MGYHATASLEEMIHPEACERTAREIADDGLEHFQSHVRRNTPIDTNPYRDRPGRPRGSARESVKRTPVRHVNTATGPAFVGSVFSDDEVFPFIEWDTPPHTIRPKEPGGTLHWRDRSSGEHRFAKEVHHPGTKGQHPFAIGAAVTEAELDTIAEPHLAGFERELLEGRA
jgi:hypothetical protein